MYIPSRFLFQLMVSEKVGVFCESNSIGDKAIIAKLPTSTIKAIALGAKVEFLVFLSEYTMNSRNIALALKVYDMADNPFHAILPLRWKNKNNMLTAGFFNKELEISIFDDTDASVLNGNIRIETNFKNKRLLHLLENFQFESSNNFTQMNRFMDLICSTITDNSPTTITTFKFKASLSQIKSILTYHANEQGVTSYDVMSDIDGTRQERQIYQALCLMNNSQTYLSPLVKIGSKERELTDVLTIMDNGGVIVLESKCLQINFDSLSKNLVKTSSNLIKHCKKAICQIEGSYKAIKRGEDVYTDEGDALAFNVQSKCYGIVLIDEYRHSNDWSDIINHLKEVSEKHNIIINIVTISELIYTMKLSCSCIKNFALLLEKRYEFCTKEESINVNFRDYSLSQLP
ncbi:hypothetical protein ABC295_001915 [Vibrio cholerae]